MTYPQPVRSAHPQSCARCRHEMTFGTARQGEPADPINGMCMRGEKRWPEGCRHYAERVK